MDEALYIEDVNTGEEEQLTQKLRDNLQVLDGYYTQMAATGGVSRDQARSLVEEFGINFGPRYPVNSFTEIPSATNCSVAMESVFNTGMQMFKDLFKKAVELLMKILRWVIDLVKLRRDRSKALAKTAHNVRTFDGARQQLAQLKFTPPAGFDGDPKQYADALAKVNEAKERYTSQFNDLWADLLEHGSHSTVTVLREISLLIFQVLPVIKSKLTVFDQLLHTTDGDGSAQELVAISQLKGIAAPIPAATLYRAIGHLQHPLAPANDLLGTFQAFYEHVQSLLEGKSYEVIDVETAAAIISHPRSGMDAPMVLLPNEALHQLEQIEGELHRLHSIEPSDLVSPEHRQAFQQAVDQLTAEVRAVQYYVQAVELYNSQQERLCNTVLYFEVQSYDFLRVQAGQGSPSDVQSANEVTARLNNELRRG